MIRIPYYEAEGDYDLGKIPSLPTINAPIPKQNQNSIIKFNPKGLGQERLYK